MLSLSWVKALVLLSLFVITFICSLIPVRLVSSARRTIDHHRRRLRFRLISFFSCFAGGVFLATCLLDLFPEVRHKLSQTFQVLSLPATFPIAEFVMVFGFFVILMIEQMVLVSQEHRIRRARGRPLLGKAGDRGVEGGEVGEAWMEQSTTSIEGISNRPQVTDDSDGEVDAGPSRYGAIDSVGGDSGYHQHEHSLHEDPSSHSALRSLLLTLALSLHSVFEGLALGLQPSLSDLLGIFLALSLHKSVLAFSLGINLAESRMALSRIIQSNLFFSLSSPLGVAIGIGISDLGPHSNKVSLTSGILQGVACGTFLYITFFEVLPHELNSPRDRMLKLLCLLLGFSCICALLLLHPDDIPDLCYQTITATTSP